MNILKNIAKFIYNVITIIVVILLIFAAYGLVQRYIFNKEYINIFGYTFFQIQTGSMSGTIEINDLIIVKITDDVHEKDIITYFDDEDIITHRVIKEEGNTLTTKGDANNTEDKPIKRNQVIGKVVNIIANFGIWKNVFSDWKVLICIVVTMTIIGIIISDKDEKKAKRRKHSFWNGIKNFIKNIKRHDET